MTSGRNVGAGPAPTVRVAALPRPGVSSSTPAAACRTAPPQSRARRGWRPTRRAEARRGAGGAAPGPDEVRGAAGPGAPDRPRPRSAARGAGPPFARRRQPGRALLSGAVVHRARTAGLVALLGAV